MCCRGEGHNKLKKNEAGCSSLVESLAVLWASAHVHVCIHDVSVCVCLYIMTGESLCCLFSDGQRREWRQSFSPTVFIHTSSSPNKLAF